MAASVRGNRVTGERDFEQAWLDKLYGGVQAVAGEDVSRDVMGGSHTLSADTPRREVIDWTRQSVEKLMSAVDEADARAVLTGCACQYPVSSLREVREAYASTGDLGLAHRMLQEQFRGFLRDVLALDEALVQEIMGRGWGLAGVIRGSTIIATKIPKSGDLITYMEETDPGRRRQLYCHCPRIREILRDSEGGWPERVAETYCYCGAGFYKGIWEEILQAPVSVDVLESVLMGDEVCKFAVQIASQEG